jgi:predicted DNA-binding protein YlxM (UPF0122 family)
MKNKKYFGKSIALQDLVRAYELHKITDLSIVEIARALQVNANTLEDNLHHAEKRGLWVDLNDKERVVNLLKRYKNKKKLTSIEIIQKTKINKSNCRQIIYQLFKDGYLKRDKMENVFYYYIVESK